MKTNTSIVAREYRLQEWAEQIRDCQSRPIEMSVSAWCRGHEISVPNYNYRLKEVRKAFLEMIPTTEDNEQAQSVVPVSTELMVAEKSSRVNQEVVERKISVLPWETLPTYH
ncbi:MAG: IS66 family insertion sequence element accessory protein TnpB [Lachnospiraceae bacterium]